MIWQRRLRWPFAAVAAWSVLALTPAAHADYLKQTVTLDQSNTLADGVIYGTVQVETYDGKGAPPPPGFAAGEARLTFTASKLPYHSVERYFGLHTVGFNTDLNLVASQIKLPAGWSLNGESNLSEFGRFTWKGHTSKSTLPSLVIRITGLGPLVTPSNFLLPASGGTAFFAAHVKSFDLRNSYVTSHWVGGNKVDAPPPPPGGQGEIPPEAPEPSTLALAGIGVVGLALARRRNRR